MRLNQIKAEQVLAAVDAFEKSIEEAAVCAAASSFHGGDVCRVFGREKGGFNLCYFVVFDMPSPNQQGSTCAAPEGSSCAALEGSTCVAPGTSTCSSNKADRWVVRIPIVPRLGCADESTGPKSLR